MEANDRSKRVLAALVRQYIASGEPVASSLLVTAAGLGVSSATVRHTLALLEDQGYVMVNAQLPEGASLERTERILQQVTNVARATPGVVPARAR